AGAHLGRACPGPGRAAPGNAGRNVQPTREQPLRRVPWNTGGPGATAFPRAGGLMRILLVTPMLPYPRALNAGPQVTYAALSELGARHDLTLATFAGPNPAERAAITALRGEGITVQSVWRPAYTGLQRWRRRAEVFGFAAHGYYDWRRGAYPRLVLRLREPEMRDVLDRLFADHSFDLLQIEDSLMASYRYPSGLPTVLIEHEVRPSAPGAHPPHTASRL